MRARLQTILIGLRERAIVNEELLYLFIHSPVLSNDLCLCFCSGFQEFSTLRQPVVGEAPEDCACG